MAFFVFRVRVLQYAAALHEAGYAVRLNGYRADGRPVLRVRQRLPG